MKKDTITSTQTTVVVPEGSETTIRQLVSATAGLRDGSELLHEDARDLHRRSLLHNLDTRTAPQAQRPVTDVLQDLAGYGFAWSAIAQLVGVSVPAVRKWRNGEAPSASNRHRLAQLVALVEFLSRDYLVDDPAGWLEVPISSEAPVTPADLYALGRTELILDWASHRLDPQSVLDEVDPNWRETFASEFEVAAWHDGQLMTVRRED